MSTDSIADVGCIDCYSSHDAGRLNTRSVVLLESFLIGNRSGNWWQRRTRLERRLSLCGTVVLFVAIGLAIAMAAIVYRTAQQPSGSNQGKLFFFSSRS